MTTTTHVFDLSMDGEVISKGTEQIPEGNTTSQTSTHTHDGDHTITGDGIIHGTGKMNTINPYSGNTINLVCTNVHHNGAPFGGGGADNLGNHTATQDLDLVTNDLRNAGWVESVTTTCSSHVESESYKGKTNTLNVITMNANDCSFNKDIITDNLKTEVLTGKTNTANTLTLNLNDITLSKDLITDNIECDNIKGKTFNTNYLDLSTDNLIKFVTTTGIATTLQVDNTTIGAGGGGGADNLGNHTATQTLNMNLNNIENIKDIESLDINTKRIYNSYDGSGVTFQDTAPAKVQATNNINYFLDTIKHDTQVKGFNGTYTNMRSYIATEDNGGYHNPAVSIPHTSNNFIHEGSFNSFGFGDKANRGSLWGGFDLIQTKVGGANTSSHRVRIYPDYNIANRFSNTSIADESNYVVEFKPDISTFKFIQRNSTTPAGGGRIPIMEWYNGEGQIGDGYRVAVVDTEGVHNGNSYTLSHYCKNHTNHTGLTDQQITDNLIGKIFMATDNCSVIQGGVEITDWRLITSNNNALTSCLLSNVLNCSYYVGILNKIIDKDQTETNFTTDETNFKNHFIKPQAHTFYEVMSKGDAMGWVILETGLSQTINKGDLLVSASVEENVVFSYDYSAGNFWDNNYNVNNIQFLTTNTTNLGVSYDFRIFYLNSNQYFFKRTGLLTGEFYTTLNVLNSTTLYDVALKRLAYTTLSNNNTYYWTSILGAGVIGQNFGGFLQPQGSGSIFNYSIGKFMGRSLTEGNVVDESYYTNSTFVVGATIFRKYRIPLFFI